MIYLTGASNNKLTTQARTLRIGLMVQPNTGYRSHLKSYDWWAADNGCFATGHIFDADAWLRWLGGWPRTALFAVAPDVVADAGATLERSRPHLATLRDMGFPPAFVAQDGIEDYPPPWDDFDALFIGGTTAFKFSEPCLAIVAEARCRRKWVHVGRVNSYKRMAFCAGIGADSVDGTFLAFGPDKNLRRLRSWLVKLSAGHQLPMERVP